MYEPVTVAATCSLVVFAGTCRKTKKTKDFGGRTSHFIYNLPPTAEESEETPSLLSSIFDILCFLSKPVAVRCCMLYTIHPRPSGGLT